MAPRTLSADLRNTVLVTVGSTSRPATARPWFWLVASGAILNLIAFSALPYIEKGQFSAAGIDLALVASQVKATFTDDSGIGFASLLSFLTPAAAIVALLLLGLSFRTPVPTRRRSWLLVGTGVVALLFTLLAMLRLVEKSGQSNAFIGTIGSGFWLMLVATSLMTVGGYLSFARQQDNRVDYTTAAAWALQKDNVLIFLFMVGLIAVNFMSATNQSTTRNLVVVCLFIIVASGLNVLVGFSGQLSLGHAAFFTVGGYVSGLFISRLHEAAVEDAARANATTNGVFGTLSPLIQNFWVCIVLSIVINGLLGLVLALPALRVKGPYLSMITIAFGFIIQETLINWTDVTRGPIGLGQLDQIAQVSPASRDLNAFGRLLPEPFRNDVTGKVQFAVFIIVATAVCIWIVKNLLKSRWGRALYALKGNEIGAASVGVNVVYSKTFAFVLSAIFAGLAGTLYAHFNNYVNPETARLLDGEVNSVGFLLAVILGGTGSLYGPIFGAAFVALLPRFLDGIKTGDGHSLAEWNLAIQAVILLLFLYVIPGGFAGATNDIWRWVRRRINTGTRDSLSINASADSGTILPIQEITHGEGPDRGVDLGKDVRTVEDNDANTENAGVAAGTPVAKHTLVFHRSRDSHEQILIVSGLTRNFKGLRAVDGVDMSLARGDVHAIIGPNGAGKTTVLNVISGLYAPSNGTISLNTQRIDGLKPHQIAGRGIARTFQNLQVFGDMSVLENVMVGFHLHTKESIVQSLFGLPKLWREDERIRGLSMQLLQFVGLEKRAEDKAKDLPYGYQRLLEIARALAVEPEILLLDEPAAGLNPKEVEDMVLLIRKIKDEGVTVLLIEHHMDLVMAISEVITVLDYGKKIAEGTPGEIQRNKRVEEAYFGTQDAAEEVAHGIHA